MRRARFRADGRLWEFIDFACEVNFANIQDVSNVDNDIVQVGSVGLTDFYVTFREVPWLGNVRVGHVQAPISLERYSSSNAWYYMERSSMFDAFYNPNDYQNGVVVFDSYLDDRVTLAGSAAWIGKSDVQSFGFGANEGKYGVGGRVTGLADLRRRRVHARACRRRLFPPGARGPSVQRREPSACCAPAPAAPRLPTWCSRARSSRPTAPTSSTSKRRSSWGRSPCRANTPWRTSATSSSRPRRSSRDRAAM